VSDFTVLEEAVGRAGLLRPARGWYRRRIALDLLVVAAAWTVVLVADQLATQLVAAIALAVAFCQIGLLAHDAAHHQILGSSRANQLLALVLFDGVVGLSLAWWQRKHGRHHHRPNHPDDDPDAAAFVLAYSEAQALRMPSGQRWIVRRQALLFLPLLMLEGFHLRHESFRSVLRGAGRYPRAEMLAISMHFAGYLSILLWRFGAGGTLLVVVAHHVAMGVYLGLVFAPNHIGMRMLGDDDGLDFVRAQVLTTRNIRPGRIVDYLFGGLNYQIEHHLFPHMPRPHLREARRIVRRFCRDRDIPYRERGAFAAYAEVLASLHRAGAPLRRARRSERRREPSCDRSLVA
jgi:fatty acid desaturase